MVAPIRILSRYFNDQWVFTLNYRYIQTPPPQKFDDVWYISGGPDPYTIHHLGREYPNPFYNLQFDMIDDSQLISVIKDLPNLNLLTPTTHKIPKSTEESLDTYTHTYYDVLGMVQFQHRRTLHHTFICKRLVLSNGANEQYVTSIHYALFISTSYPLIRGGIQYSILDMYSVANLHKNTIEAIYNGIVNKADLLQPGIITTEQQPVKH